MSNDFIMQQQMRPEKEKACFHCSLSFYPGEVLNDELMVKIAKGYLEKLGITTHNLQLQNIRIEDICICMLLPTWLTIMGRQF